MKQTIITILQVDRLHYNIGFSDNYLATIEYVTAESVVTFLKGLQLTKQNYSIVQIDKDESTLQKIENS